jgi:hypothetical protein
MAKAPVQWSAPLIPHGFEPMKYVSTITAVVAVTALVAGCAGSEPPGEDIAAELRAVEAAASPAPTPLFSGVRSGEILRRAGREVARATSFHIVLNTVSSKGPLTVDLSLGRGQRAVGTITQDGQTAKIRRIGRNLWVRAGRGFWKKQIVPPSAVSRLAGRWVRMGRDNDLTGQFFTLTDLSAVRKDYVVDADTAVPYTGRTPGRTIDGHRTVRLFARARDILDDSEYQISLYIAGDGPVVPLHYERRSSRKKHAETRVFSGWNEPVTVTPPPGAVDPD